MRIKVKEIFLLKIDSSKSIKSLIFKNYRFINFLKQKKKKSYNTQLESLTNNENRKNKK